MVSLEKLSHLALESRFDSLGQSIHVDSGKLNALGAGTRYDICTSSGCTAVPGVCHSFTHDGRCISLFKTLFTNYCTHQCSYCSSASNCRERSGIYSYAPEELARLTLSLYRCNYVEGLFLSSGAGRDEDLVMERILETARLLRLRHGFPGYLHLKILPGASRSHIQEAMELADRLSVNLEAPSASRLGEICPTKNYESDILRRQRYIRDLMRRINLPAGQTTQLVVGGSEESDLEIFHRIFYEYEALGIRRVYYSAFHPIRGTAFELKEAQPLWREHRLYQMDWLYRVYRFKREEILVAFNEDGLLINADPKEIIARKILEGPIDPNTAGYGELVRVPGIGPRSARRILGWRRRQRISRKDELSGLGVRFGRAAPFLKLNGLVDATLERWLV
jgi:predicted DNA-binding helix-hairpin-helix protein